MAQKKLTLHRARLVDWTPAAVTAVAATADGRAVAVGREDGEIELYNVGEDWQCVLRIPGAEGTLLTALVWCDAASLDEEADTGGQRLVSAGLSGQVVEYDLLNLCPKSSLSSFGGPVWHLAAQPPLLGTAQLLALACDDGCLRLCGLRAERGLHYVRSFPKVEARLLSTAWHTNRRTVVTGSSDGCVRCWDTQTMSELLRITVSTGRQLQVWSVLVLADGTLVSGDSGGGTRFWDGAHGTQLQAFQTHQADVLCLAALPCGSAVFAAGVDSKVVQLQRVGGGGAAAAAASDGWAVTSSKRPHTHDVRALAIAPFPKLADDASPRDTHVLLSGGTDAQLLAYAADDFGHEHPVRVVRLPPTPSVGLAPRANADAPAYMLCACRATLDVWRMGVAQSSSEGAAVAHLASGPQHLIRITTAAQRALFAAAISPCGRYAAASDGLRTFLFTLELTAGRKPSVAPAQLSARVPGARHVAFVDGASSLLLICADGTAHLVDVQSGEVSTTWREHLKGDGSSGAAAAVAADTARRGAAQLPPVSAIAVSADGRLAAIAVSCSRWGGFAGAARKTHICIYDTKAKRACGRLAPPPGDGGDHPLTAMNFTPAGDGLVVVTALNTVHMATATAAAATPATPSRGSGGGAAGAGSWRWDGGAAAGLSLRALPGHVTALSADPARGAGCLIAHSLLGLALVDVAHNGYNSLYQAADGPAAGGAAAGAEGGAAAASRAAKRQRRPKPAPGAVGGAAARGGGSGGGGGRVALDGFGYAHALEHPCLFAGHLGPEEAVIVERPWDDMLRSLPFPLHRHRFGT